MAYIRCICSNKRTLQETVLWENPNPTSSFATQTITLSDSIMNYNMIRIEGRRSTSIDDYLEVYADPEYLVTCATAKTENAGNCGLAASTGAGSTGSRYTRVFVSTTANPDKITVGNEYSMATTTSNNTYAIPTRIVGIK